MTVWSVMKSFVADTTCVACKVASYINDILYSLYNVNEMYNNNYRKIQPGIQSGLGEPPLCYTGTIQLFRRRWKRNTDVGLLTIVSRQGHITLD